MSYAINVSIECKIEFNSHADATVEDDNCIIINDHNRQVNVYGYDTIDGHKAAKTVMLLYVDLYTSQCYILLLN